MSYFSPSSLLSHLVPARVESGEGTVYLVGAGPGDPELLTLRALKLLQAADVVLYDALVDPRILGFCRADARRVAVGKRCGRHSCRQADIHERLIAYARRGHRVVRLKGGDPLLFSRGGEEIEALAAAGVPFEIVPGISAANGCAAYAGIPLTHRDHAQSCVFVTGHTRDGRLDLDWSQLTRPRQTVVVFMGLRTLPLLCAGLIRHGLLPEMPAAVVENGTRSGQRVVAGSLASLPEQVRRAGLEGAALEGPALVIVGSVVCLREKLGWFDGEGDEARAADALTAAA